MGTDGIQQRGLGTQENTKSNLPGGSGGEVEFETIEKRIRNRTIEEVAAFVETHYCVINAELGYPHYKTFDRPKHPAEPLAAAIRGMKK